MDYHKKCVNFNIYKLKLLFGHHIRPFQQKLCLVSKRSTSNQEIVSFFFVFLQRCGPNRNFEIDAQFDYACKMLICLLQINCPLFLRSAQHNTCVMHFNFNCKFIHCSENKTHRQKNQQMEFFNKCCKSKCKFFKLENRGTFSSLSTLIEPEIQSISVPPPNSNNNRKKVNFAIGDTLSSVRDAYY